MKKITFVVCLLFSLFLVAVASAHSVGYNLDSGKTIYKEKISKNYYGDDNYVYSKTIYGYGSEGKKYSRGHDYDRDNSHSYSGHFSDSYWNNRDKYDSWTSQGRHSNQDYDHSNSWDHTYSSRRTYDSESISPWGSQEKNCYMNPPANQLFYFKCPWA